ncbi:hypothetical protein AGMMS50268_26650 [Spirochaetia bacterium]|nr:hypothetical protein AGMMS50268_26650 [Spirochaetia bacterium]
MDIVIEFNESAFGHSFTKEDIRQAILNWKYDDIDGNNPGKHLLLGFDNKGRLLEIMYNVIDECTINVFHAMKCQKKYHHLLNP